MGHITINSRIFSIQYPDTREASVYAAHPYSVPWWMFTTNAAVAMAHKIHELPPSQSILDVGCGLGLTAIVAQSLGHTVYVTDLFGKCYEYVKLNAETNGVLPPVWVDSINDIPTQSLDCVLMCDMLYHPPTSRQTVTDVIRCIRSNGRLMIAQPPRLKEEFMMQSFDVFKRPYVKDTIILDSIIDPSEVKDDYTTTNIYTFKV